MSSPQNKAARVSDMLSPWASHSPASETVESLTGDTKTMREILDEAPVVLETRLQFGRRSPQELRVVHKTIGDLLARDNPYVAPVEVSEPPARNWDSLLWAYTGFAIGYATGTVSVFAWLLTR